MRLFRNAPLPAVGCFLACCCLAATSHSADPPTSPAAPAAATSSTLAPPTVVVLDLALVFKSHLRFKQRMDEIRQEMADHDKEIAAARQEILAQGARLRDFKSGSLEYKRIEERAARDHAELRVKALSRKNEIFDREGKVYFETYQEIVAAVANLAERHNISLVASYDSESMDKDDRGSILKAINREVVFQRGLDITKLVIEQVNSPRVVSSHKKLRK